MKKLRRALAAAVLAAASGIAVAAGDLDAIRQMAEQGQRAGALEKLAARIEANENDLQARFLRGMLLFEAGELDAARQSFADIARRFPRLPGAFNNLAVIYASQGEYEKARQALLSAIANAPDYPAVRANLGDLYTKMAADAYREAVELDPSDQASVEKLRLLDNLFGPAPGG